MSSKPLSEEIARYTLATGEAAAHRLEVLHEIWGSGTRDTALTAGLSKGMKVVDFGCGIGTVSVMFAEMVGKEGAGDQTRPPIFPVIPSILSTAVFLSAPPRLRASFSHPPFMRVRFRAETRRREEDRKPFPQSSSRKRPKFHPPQRNDLSTRSGLRMMRHAHSC